MSELEKLQQALTALETQRDILGDDVVDAALAPMQEKIATLQAQEPAADPRLKLVTVLFTDVTGSTQISQRLDPEDMLEVMDGAMKRLGKIIEQHRGRVIKYMGDGLMALFGDTITREDDAEQAVRAGLEIIREARHYGQKVEREWDLDGFNVRVGINTGQIILGGGVEADNTAMGMTINLAQRMESSAPVGGLRISRATFRHVRTAFDLTAQPPIRVKGKDEPIETYLVMGAKERRFHSPRSGVEGVSTQLIGREVELTRIQEFFFDAAEGGETQIVTVVGDPGVGKSRLLYEFERWLQARPEQVALFKGRSDQNMEGVPYGLLRNLFANRCRISDSDDAVETRRKFEECLAPQFSGDARLKSHFIGALLGFDFSDSVHLRGIRDNPAQLREQAQFYLIQFFTSTAERGPTLLFLEDIHWADSPSLDFIQRLNRECPHLQLVVLSLARPALFERRPHWGIGQTIDEATNSRINVKPLSKRACHQLIDENLKKIHSIPPVLRDLIMNNAEGNPFYVEEIINILIDDGVIVRDEANINWRVETDKLDEVRVPPTLTAVLEARLDKLPADEKLTLQQAAVVGRIFWDAILEILHSGNGVVGDQLETLYERELIFPRPATAFSGANEFLFKHMLLRDVAYDTVLKRARRIYHKQIAEWLVETCRRNNRTDEYPAAIGEHYALAGNDELAADWLLLAAEKAHAQGAPAEAHSLLDRTLTLIPESDQERRWQVLLVKDKVLGFLGETEIRKVCGDELLSLAKTSEDDEMLAHAYFRKANLATSLGDERLALRFHMLALDSIQKTNNRRLETLILGMVVISQTRLGDLASAAVLAGEALMAAEKLGDDEILARTRTNVAFYYAEAGDVARAVQVLEQQVALCQKLENRFGETVGQNNLGYNYVLLGLFTLGRSVLEKALILADSIGARRLNAFARYNLGLVHWRQGNLDQATTLVTGALQDLDKIGDAFGVAAGHSYYALVLESQGDIESALENYTTAGDTFKKLGAQAYAGDALAGIVRCFLVQKNLDAARVKGEQLWDYLTNSSSAGMEFPAFAYQTCAEAFTLLDEPFKARQSTETGYSILMEQAVKISDPAWRNSFLGNVPENRRLVDMWNRLAATKLQ